MATQMPLINAWYEDAQTSEIFEIVAVDETNATIEIQYLGGELGELDFESWQQMVLLPAEAPEDSNAAYEPMDDDIHHFDGIIMPGFMDDPLSSIESESFYGTDDY